jgi:hypothetical protein
MINDIYDRISNSSWGMMFLMLIALTIALALVFPGARY